MIDPATGWFEIIKVSTFDLDKVTGIMNTLISHLPW